MTFAAEKLKNISHPLVASMYMKKDFKARRRAEDVLVIETTFSDDDPDESGESFDSYLSDLLLDLQNLKNQAERRVGKFDRVDIRTH